jgi:hypothetical protein
VNDGRKVFSSTTQQAQLSCNSRKIEKEFSFLLEEKKE